MSPAILATRRAHSMTTNEFSTSEASRICGVSKRQLQWIDEQSIVSPRQYGRKRHYVAEELLSILIIEWMRKNKGVSLLKTRPVARWLQKGMGHRLSEIIETAAAGNSTYLLSDGASSHHLIDSPAQLMDKMIAARRPMMLMCVSCLADRIPPKRNATASITTRTKPARRTRSTTPPPTTTHSTAA